MEEAAAAAGGKARLAELLSVSYQAVWKWGRIPADRVLEIEAITGISRERLRPDLYGAPRPRPKRRHSISAAA